MTRYFCWFFFTISLSCFALEEEVKQVLLKDLQTAKYYLENKYAPFAWKKKHLNWDVEQEYQTVKSQIEEGQLTTLSAYQKALKNFFLSSGDYHVNIAFYSTEQAFFPLSIKRVDDQYFVTEVVAITPNRIRQLFKFDPIDLNLFEKNIHQLQRGDEVIAFNGIDMKQVMQQIIEEDLQGDFSDTGYCLAEKTLFFRRGRLGIEVPKGNFQLTIRSKKRKKIVTLELPWFHVAEWVNQPPLLDLTACVSSLQKPSQNSLPNHLESYFAKEFVSEEIKELVAPQFFGNRKEKAIEKTANLDQRMQGFLPPLGPIIWQTAKDKKIYAYLYQGLDKQKIGYIHLPSFSFEGEYGSLMEELMTVISRFEQEAKALVFDTTNNTGGNLLFMYAALSLLTDRPLALPTHREMILQEDVLLSSVAYQELVHLREKDKKGTISGYPFDTTLVEQLKAYSLEVIRNWEDGKRMTDPLYLMGIEQIMPCSIHFSKPLMILVNELNLSCGDFFPAILQDNGRAKIFGNRTGGAGGHVKRYSYLSRLGVESLSITASIATRTTGLPIENLGVTPDIFYLPSKKDVCGHYEEYIDVVNQEIKKLLM